MARAAFIAPLNASLSTWGSKLVGSTDYPADMSAVAGHVFDLHVVKNDPISFDASFKPNSSGDFTTTLLNVAFVMICLGMLFVCLLSNGDDHEDGSGPSPPQKLDSLRDVQRREGSWAQAYRDAKGEDKEALELLFRCHIISTYEFAESKVSQEHIDECTWIGSHMLRQRPLADWVYNEYQAKKIFEEHVVACHQARRSGRSDSRSSRHRSRTPTPDYTPHTTRQSLSTSSSLSVESQLKSTPRLSIQITRVDYPFAEEAPYKIMPRPAWPAMQPPRMDYLCAVEHQQKAPVRAPIQIPRVDLRSLSVARGELAKEDDDDPYTTRDIF